MPAFQQFLDVLPAFRMARARRIGVSQLIHQQQTRRTGERRVQVELVQRDAAQLDTPTRQHGQAREQRFGLAAPMRFDHTDDDIDAVLAQPARGRKHRIGLADTGRCAKVDAQPSRRDSPAAPSEAASAWIAASNASGSGVGPRCRSRLHRVQCEVQFKHVDTRLPDHFPAEAPSCDPQPARATRASSTPPRIAPTRAT